jgi:hypothetical protein
MLGVEVPIQGNIVVSYDRELPELLSVFIRGNGYLQSQPWPRSRPSLATGRLLKAARPAVSQLICPVCCGKRLSQVKGESRQHSVPPSSSPGWSGLPHGLRHHPLAA